MTVVSGSGDKIRTFALGSQDLAGVLQRAETLIGAL